MADGVGGHKGGREAAELTVRCFFDAYYSLPETLGARRIASRALEAANSWIYAQGRVDSRLSVLVIVLPKFPRGFRFSREQ